MKIRKTEPSVGILGKIVNLFSNSTKDTYSCDYINSKLTVIEAGKNNNGTYIKYSNGYMECSHTITTDTQNTSSHYQSGAWTYPATFVQTPDVCATAYNWQTNAYFVKVNPSLESAMIMQHVLGASSLEFIDRKGDKVCLKASGWWKLPEE